MESDLSTLCTELDNIFLECPTDKSGCAEVQCLIDAFVNKYGSDKPQLRSIISEKLDAQGFNPSISRSCFKRMIMEWIVSFNPDVPVAHYTESSTTVDRDVFEYDASSYAHSTPLGRFNQRARKIPQKKLSYSPALGFMSETSIENQVSPCHEELRSFRTATKAHNSSLENSLVKAEQKIFALEEELKKLKVHSRKDSERLREEINQYKHFEKLYAGSVNKIEKYAETLNNLTKEYNRLKNSKEDLFKEYSNLEIEHHRLQNEIDAKNISIRALETWKRVQTEELVVLNDSKSLLESEVYKLKDDLKSRSENEESLLMRIGELQSEKQKLQTELNEVMNVENLKLVTSSPFGKSLSHEDQYSDRSEENRESGISVRSELIDSLGFSSCIDETLHLPYLSVLNRTDIVSFACGATAMDLLGERSQSIDQEIQTEQITENRLELIEKEMQTEIIDEKPRVLQIEKEIQTDPICETRVPTFDKEMQTDVIRTRRFNQNDKGVQIELIKEKSSKQTQKGVQTDQIIETRILKVEKDSQTEVVCETRMEIDDSLEEFHRSIASFAHRGRTGYDGYDLTSDNNGRPNSASSFNIDNESICSSSSERRIRRLESRRLSCLDVYNKPLTICRSNTYQKMTFTQRLSTVVAGMFSILAPGLRICMKTLVWLVTASMLFFTMVILILIVSWKHDGIPRQYFWPYIVLKYPKGPPPV
ncbi:unnamed protein product [Nezara viridula]|uniref:Uncharacterized protein n=1 Tax=Nezara viridula TaxID=85310 RepID=A0A9P0DYC6_NEZVI|nr:unnamed protein product [Nezara viridula]